MQVDAAREGEPGLAPAQALAGEMDGDQGGGLGGVQGQTGTAELEEVGEPVGDEGALGAGHGVVGACFVSGVLVEESGVVVRVDSDEDPYVEAPQCGGADAGVLHGLPPEFQHEALLGVREFRFAGRDAEEVGVEVGDPVEEGSTFESRRVPEAGEVRRVVGPPAVPGHVGDGVPTVAQHVPQLIGSVGLRQAAGDPDDRDGVVGDVCRPEFLGCDVTCFAHRRSPFGIGRQSGW